MSNLQNKKISIRHIDSVCCNLHICVSGQISTTHAAVSIQNWEVQKTNLQQKMSYPIKTLKTHQQALNRLLMLRDTPHRLMTKQEFRLAVWIRPLNIYPTVSVFLPSNVYPVPPGSAQNRPRVRMTTRSPEGTHSSLHNLLTWPATPPFVWVLPVFLVRSPLGGNFSFTLIKVPQHTTRRSRKDSRVAHLYKRHLPKKMNYSLKQIAAYEYFITDKGREGSGLKRCGMVEIVGLVIS